MTDFMLFMIRTTICFDMRFMNQIIGLLSRGFFMMLLFFNLVKVTNTCYLVAVMDRLRFWFEGELDYS